MTLVAHKLLAGLCMKGQYKMGIKTFSLNGNLMFSNSKCSNVYFIVHTNIIAHCLQAHCLKKLG